MKLNEIYKKQGRVLSFEIFPPKFDDELKDIDETLGLLCELKPDYISVTFGAGGSSNNNKTIRLARKIKDEYGVEPVVHLTCLHYDKAEVNNFCKEIADAGIENILALRGDRNPNLLEKDDFAHASDLISYIKNSSYDFCIAGACYPECHPESNGRVDEFRNLKTKVDSGAEVLLSQLFFDNDMFYKFVEDSRIAGIDVPITPGIMPVVNAKQIKRMVTTCGASLPVKFERIVRRYEDNNEALLDAGVNYAVSQIIDLLASDCDGIHLYTMNNPKVVKKICDEIKNIV